MIKSITLKNNQKVSIDTRLNVKKLMFINRDFDTREIVKITVGKDESMDFDFIKAYKAVYVAYRQANMNDYMNFDDFCNQYDLDIQEASDVYSEMFLNANKNSKYAEAFKKETFKKKGHH